MIQAQKSWWAERIFRWYIFRVLRRQFVELYLVGDQPEMNPDYPVILLPNHSTWWDGFFVYLLNERILHRDLHLMMTEEQLLNFPFFRRVGAYSIKPESPKSVKRTLDYTIDILNSNNSEQPLICIFPQGELLPWGQRPLKFQRGLEWILKHYVVTATLLPLAMKAFMHRHQRPEVAFLFGESIEVDSQYFSGMAWLESLEERLLDNLQQDLNAGKQKQVILQGSKSVSNKWLNAKHHIAGGRR